MPTAVEVASWIVRHAHEQGDEITQLKLQKLCYYAQGYHLAIHGTPLFTDPIEAWDKGPVIYALRREYGHHKSAPIPQPDGVVPDSLSSRAVAILAATYREFRDASGSMLVSKTHRKRPWLAAREDGVNGEISLSHMRSHFTRVLGGSIEPRQEEDPQWFFRRLRTDESLKKRIAASHADKLAGRTLDAE